jgi:transposase-like protein
MGTKKHSTEQIVSILRQFEVEMAGGKKVEDIAKTAGICVNTYYKWKQNYGGLDISEAKRLRELEYENDKLKKIVAELSVDNMILKEFKKKVESA